MKKIYLLICLLLPVALFAQIPAGYYNPATGLTGQQLKVALRGIIRTHTTLSYTPGLWNAYSTTDKKPDGKLWDIYSDIPGGTAPYEFVLVNDQCSGSSPSAEDGCYNREHTWPQSKFASTPPMYTDLYLVYPTDYYVNSNRGDLPYGIVGGSVTHTFMNGSKTGNNAYPGAPSGNCFEPIDSFKGDIARNYFYISTCYSGVTDSTSFIDWEMATKTSLNPWAAEMLLLWHELDPVSQKEINRNNAVYTIQGNRNPFIDHPEYAECIWGNGDCALMASQLNKERITLTVSPNPAKESVKVSWQEILGNKAVTVSVCDVAGRLQYSNNMDANAGNALTIPTSAWAKGVYFLRLQTLQNVQTQKIVVE